MERIKAAESGLAVQTEPSHPLRSSHQAGFRSDIRSANFSVFMEDGMTGGTLQANTMEPSHPWQSPQFCHTKPKDSQAGFGLDVRAANSSGMTEEGAAGGTLQADATQAGFAHPALVTHTQDGQASIGSDTRAANLGQTEISQSSHNSVNIRFLRSANPVGRTDITSAHTNVTQTLQVALSEFSHPGGRHATDIKSFTQFRQSGQTLG